jgi:4-hydroxy-3-methylbut-2-enyl diphosphate reductase
MGIRFLPAVAAGSDHLAPVGPDDVVIIPAFGVPHEDLSRLKERGSILVDTTCGSVLTVWKSVERFARGGITAIIHGKVDHEETRATCSQVTQHPGAHWLVVRDREEAASVCEFLEGRLARGEFLERFEGKFSSGFDPERDLGRLGCANQTTMLSSESLEIAELLRAAVARRDGGAAVAFHSFDTICSATQERQDAVLELVGEGCDLMIVIGGFNSSNTNHLVEIASRRTVVRHIEDAANLISPRWIRHKPLGAFAPVMTESWLPDGPLRIGVTAGASTPDSEIGESIARLLSFRGVPAEELEALVRAGHEATAARRERERARIVPTEGPTAPPSEERPSP